MSGDTPPPSGADASGPIDGGETYVSNPLAEWIWRVLSFLIDAIPPIIVYSIGWFFYAQVFTSTKLVTHTTSQYPGLEYTTLETSTSAAGYAVAALFYIVATVYWFWNKGFKEGTTGKSIGKRITGHTTLREGTDQPLGAAMGCLRALLIAVDFMICYIGVLWPLWDQKRQCLVSDKVTKALVWTDEK